jgi:hypothetical protein
MIVNFVEFLISKGKEFQSFEPECKDNILHALVCNATFSQNKWFTN